METGEPHRGGICVFGVQLKTESPGIDVSSFLARAAGPSSECGFCCVTKYGEMSSSCMLDRDSQVLS